MCSVGDDEVSVNMSRFKKELESALGSSDIFAEFSHDPSAYDLDISDSDMDYGKLQKTVFSDFSCCNFQAKILTERRNFLRMHLLVSYVWALED
jgi:hypothetical protein